MEDSSFMQRAMNTLDQHTLATLTSPPVYDIGTFDRGEDSAAVCPSQHALFTAPQPLPFPTAGDNPELTVQIDNQYQASNSCDAVVHVAVARVSSSMSWKSSADSTQSAARRGHKPAAGRRTGSSLQGSAVSAASASSTSADAAKDHIIAERRRREKINQRLMELSTLIPGLKKMNKAAIIGDAVEHVRELQEKVQTLENNNKHATKTIIHSTVLVHKKKHSLSDLTSHSSDEDVAENSHRSTWLPEIEVRLSDKSVLIQIHCENMKGILVSVLAEVEALRLALTHTSNMPFLDDTTIINITAKTGMSGALETLCGQAYGAKLYRMLGLYLQSSLIMSAVVSVLISVLWLFTESLLLCLGQDPEVSRAAALFIRYQIPGLFAYSFLQCLLRYLQTQSFVVPLVVCSMVPFALHVAVNYLLVNMLGLGLAGASIAISATFWVSCLMLLAYVMWSREFEETWKGFSAEAFNYLLPTIKLAMPSAIMVCLEYWAIELLVLIAGLLPNSTVSTSLIAICASTEAISYMITYGFSAAVSTRVSNEIGAGNVDRAKNAVVVTLKLAVFLALSFILLLIVGHGLWANLFTGDAVIAAKFAAITPLLTFSIVLDSMQGVLSGVARGCGWQHLAAMTNLVAFYLAGMPVAILFAFKLNFYTHGLWLGFICGLACQTSAMVVITLRTKWSKLVEVMQKNRDGYVA